MKPVPYSPGNPVHHLQNKINDSEKLILKCIKCYLMQSVKYSHPLLHMIYFPL